MFKMFIKSAEVAEFVSLSIRSLGFVARLIDG